MIEKIGYIHTTAKILKTLTNEQDMYHFVDFQNFERTAQTSNGKYVKITQELCSHRLAILATSAFCSIRDMKLFPTMSLQDNAPYRQGNRRCGFDPQSPGILIPPQV